MAKYQWNLRDGLDALVGTGGIAITCAFSPLLKSWYHTWGTTSTETVRTLPGDDLVPSPAIVATRAITILAAPSYIWPLLLQLGLRRGGWYSYDALEAIAGAADFTEGHSSRRIVPELQDLKIGDRIWMHDRILPLTVTAMEPERFLVFLTRVDIRTKSYFELDNGLPERFVNSSWAFFLESPEKETTRLLVRSRLDYSPNLINDIAWRVFTDPISFIMERKMLLTLKRIAETSQKMEPGGFEPPTSCLQSRRSPE